MGVMWSLVKQDWWGIATAAIAIYLIVLAKSYIDKRWTKDNRKSALEIFQNAFKNIMCISFLGLMAVMSINPTLKDQFIKNLGIAASAAIGTFQTVANNLSSSTWIWVYVLFIIYFLYELVTDCIAFYKSFNKVKK